MTFSSHPEMKLTIELFNEEKVMKQKNYPLHVVLIIVGLAFLALTGCTPKVDSASLEGDGAAPATVERLEGNVPTRLTLTEDAAKRLDVQTIEARVAQASSSSQTAVPYSSIIYDVDGHTWLYTSPKDLTYERTPIVVDHIDGDVVFLSDGPPAGTAVVTRGVAELYGAETEFAEE
jgi:hypothetical protein